MKKPFINPIFRYLDESHDARTVNRMGFAYQLAIPEIDAEVYADDPDKFFKEWDMPEEIKGYKLAAAFDNGDGPVAMYVKPLTHFAEELLALGLRHMRGADYMAVEERPSRQKDWVGLDVVLMGDVTNGHGETFPKGMIMQVVGAYRGLTLEEKTVCPHCSFGNLRRVRQVPVSAVKPVMLVDESDDE